MDLFAKCAAYTTARECRERGIYPYFHALESRQDTEVIMEGKRRIMLGSNNYLGLTAAPEVIAAAEAALAEYGTGCSGSRFLNGTLRLHLELERELADFVHKDGAVTFSTGFQSNLGIISALVGRGDYVICDRENHASIYDGCRLSFGKMLRYRHADMDDLEAKLKAVPESAGCLIVTDGVFSMGGDIAKLPEICDLAEKYGARVMVDDAHGLGVIGEGGQPLRARGQGGRHHGHLLQVAREPRRLYGGVRARLRLCPPQLAALHLLCLHPALQLRRGPRGSAAFGGTSGAPAASKCTGVPRKGRAEGQGSEDNRVGDADNPHLYL